MISVFSIVILSLILDYKYTNTSACFISVSTTEVTTVETASTADTGTII